MWFEIVPSSNVSKYRQLSKYNFKIPNYETKKRISDFVSFDPKKMTFADKISTSASFFDAIF